MSVLKPARRWQPPFYPFKREKRGRRMLAVAERIIKGPLFGCRMCGNCLLQETAFICPMECPKGMRNGPCGGMTPDKHCYVDDSRMCVWYAIYKRSFDTGRQERLLEILPPLDYTKTGTETWGDVIQQAGKTGISGLFSRDRSKRNETMERIFKPVRQPEWWNGDSQYHSPGYIEPVSGLEKKLRNGEFVVTTEVTPPLGASTGKLRLEIEMVSPYVSAVNFTDSSSARPRMSSVACCSVALNEGVEPVIQITARDTTRTNLQATAMGLNALGIRNVLCLTGDNPSIGGSPVASMNIIDIDSVQMLWILRKMRDEGIYLDGRKMKNPPSLFLGAATSPQSSDPRFQAIKDIKKINAGAQFFQTNLIFEPDRLDSWLEQLDKRGMLNKVYIIAGIAPLKNLKIAEYLHTWVPGVNIPPAIFNRLEKAGDSVEEESVQIVLEQVDILKRKKGINGIHIMPLGWETVVERIITDSGLGKNQKAAS